MAFTSWTNLVVTVKNDIASGNFMAAEYDMNGKKIKYRSLPEIMKFLERIEALAARETTGFNGFVTMNPRS
jgi:hypothetical protein